MKLNIYIYLLICCFTHFSTKAQEVDIEKLRKTIATTNDHEEKMQSLYELGELLYKENPEEAISLGHELMELSEKHKNHRWKTSAFYLLGRAYLTEGQADYAEKFYKEAIEFEYSFEKVDNKKLAWAEHNIGNYYKHRGNYNEAIKHFKISLELEKKNNNVENQASCLLNIGAMYLYLGQTHESIDPLKQSRDLSLSIQDTATAQSCITNLAMVYESQGDYSKALDEFDLAEKYAQSDHDLGYIYGNRGSIYYNQGKIKQALSTYRKTVAFFASGGHELEQAMTLLNMGVMLKDQGNIERAIKEYRKSEQLFLKLGNDDLLSSVYLNLAGAFNEKEWVDSAYFYYEKGLELSLKTENINNIGNAYHNLGVLDLDKKKYVSAKNNIEKAIGFFSQSNEAKSLSNSYYKMAQIYLAQNNISEGMKYAKRALNMAESVGDTKLLIELYDIMVHLSVSALGQEKIYDYHLKQIELIDSLRSTENFKAVEELSTQYGVKEMEDSISFTKELLEQQRTINKNKTVINQQKEKMLWGAFAGGGILFLLLVLIFFSRKKIKKKNRENEILLGEVHHRVKNNLQVVSSLLSLQEKDMTDEAAKKAILEGKERVNSIGLIHKLLYQDDRFSGIEMQEYTQKLIESLSNTFGYKAGEIKTDITMNKIWLDVDSAIPIGLIINELTVNSLKYAFDKERKNELEIGLKEKDQQLVLSFRDNGPGKKDDLYVSDSFGYRLVQSLTKQLDGKLEIDDTDGLHYHLFFKSYKRIQS